MNENPPPHDHTMMVIDTETTGLETPPTDQVVEVAAIYFVNGIVTDEYTTLVNPGSRFFGSRWKECERFHGIKQELCRAAIGTSEAAAGLADFITANHHDGMKLHAFNRSFDKRMLTARDGFNLSKLLADRGCTTEWGECIMLAMETETKFGGLQPSRSAQKYGMGQIRQYRISLDDSCALMKLDRGEIKHRAVHDAYDAGRLYLKILEARKLRREQREEINDER